MASPFLAEIVMFAGDFAPRGWAYTSGQLMAISSNSALFSLLGCTYGGDCRTSFALPELRGRTPLHPGRGPGLSTTRLGQRGGTQEFTIFNSQLPSHSHHMVAENGLASSPAPDNNMLSTSGAGLVYKAFNSGNGEKLMASQSIGNTGGGQPVNKVSPFTSVNFIIALQGVFPSRS